MALSPYDELCEGIRFSAAAAGAVVIVFRGKHGSGYSIRSDPELPAIAPAIPEILRDMADQMESDLSRQAHGIRKAICR